MRARACSFGRGPDVFPLFSEILILLDDLYLLGETLTTLESGGTIVYPTDTVWGIGCDATNEAAVQRVASLKERPPGAGFVCIVDSLEMLLRYVDSIHPRLQTLLDFHTRPLTMIYPDVERLAPGVLAADGSAAIRITRDAYCKALLKAFGKPLVSTSANLRGQPFPEHFGTISSEVLAAADHVVRFRQRDRTPSEPSVIARWTADNELEPVRG